jgi:D-lactate dehydrogenase (cytochrome)
MSIKLMALGAGRRSHCKRSCLRLYLKRAPLSTLATVSNSPPRLDHGVTIISSSRKIAVPTKIESVARSRTLSGRFVRSCRAPFAFSTHAANDRSTIVQSARPAVSDETVQKLLAEIKESFPESYISTSNNKYELHRHGKGEDCKPSIQPQAIVYPKSAKAVQDIVLLCEEPQYRVPMIAFGTGTSLEGHVSALCGGISIDTSYLQYNANADAPDMEPTKISEDFEITVGAGVTRQTLNKALRYTGLQFVVDPGADASIGGMVACGASGTTAVKYGTMKDNVLALEAVLPNGDIIQTGTKAAKSSAGYDLTRLLCGSEGTLGIITKVTVKLHPIPACVMAAVCRFDTLHDAAEAVASIKQCGVDVQRLELLDGTSIEAFNKYNAAKSIGGSNKNSPILPVQPHLFLEFAGASSVSVEEQVSLTKSICGCDEDDGESLRFRVETSEGARQTLWAARHQLYYASIALREGAESAVVTDACVPLSEFANVVEATAKDIEELKLIATVFGHAGDGNFHTILPTHSQQDATTDYRQRIDECNHRLIRRTLAVGGTCTGEHGVGWGKIKYLKEQYSPETISMMRAIKHALDPYNVMNPGKIIEWR